MKGKMTMPYQHLTLRVQQTKADDIGDGWGDEDPQEVAERATRHEVLAVMAEYPGAQVEVWGRVPEAVRVEGATTPTEKLEITENLAEIRAQSWQEFCA